MPELPSIQRSNRTPRWVLGRSAYSYRQDQSPAGHMVIFPIGQSRCFIGTLSPARKKFLAADVEPAEVCGHYWV